MCINIKSYLDHVNFCMHFHFYFRFLFPCCICWYINWGIQYYFVQYIVSSRNEAAKLGMSFHNCRSQLKNKQNKGDEFDTSNFTMDSTPEKTRTTSTDDEESAMECFLPNDLNAGDTVAVAWPTMFTVVKVDAAVKKNARHFVTCVELVCQL